MPAQDVRADWSDDDGLLALSLVTPIRIPPLTGGAADAGRVAAFGGSIWDRTVAAKARILATVTAAQRGQPEPGGHPDQRGQDQRRRPGAVSSSVGARGTATIRAAGDAALPEPDMRRILCRETRSSRAGWHRCRRPGDGAGRLRTPGSGRACHRPAGLADRTADCGGAARRAARGDIAPAARRHRRRAGHGGAVLPPQRRAARAPRHGTCSRRWPNRASRRRGGRRSDRLRPGPPCPAGRQCHTGAGHGGGFPAPGHCERPPHVRACLSMGTPSWPPSGRNSARWPCSRCPKSASTWHRPG